MCDLIFMEFVNMFNGLMRILVWAAQFSEFASVTAVINMIYGVQFHTKEKTWWMVVYCACVCEKLID
jgi:hypothetical protein